MSKNSDNNVMSKVDCVIPKLEISTKRSQMTIAVLLFMLVLIFDVLFLVFNFNVDTVEFQWLEP